MQLHQVGQIYAMFGSSYRMQYVWKRKIDLVLRKRNSDPPLKELGPL